MEKANAGDVCAGVVGCVTRLTNEGVVSASSTAWPCSTAVLPAEGRRVLQLNRAATKLIWQLKTHTVCWGEQSVVPHAQGLLVSVEDVPHSGGKGPGTPPSDAELF